jgi:hypothetical protein
VPELSFETQTANACEVVPVAPAAQLNQSFAGTAHPHKFAWPALIGVPIK